MTNYQVATIAASVLGLVASAVVHKVDVIVSEEDGDVTNNMRNAVTLLAFLAAYGLGHILATPFV